MRNTFRLLLPLTTLLAACSSSSPDDASGSGGAQATGDSSSGGTSSSMNGNGTTTVPVAGGGTSEQSDEIILYDEPYEGVNMWYGPVDYSESVYHNACGLSDGTVYADVIQNLYGNYLIGLDGEHVANVESHCDDCAQLTANGNTIVAHIITYGIENGDYAIDLSPEAQEALGLSSSDWIGTWQFSSCPTNGTPIYYQFDSRQWDENNFWYMRLWTRNQRIPVALVETNVDGAGWAAATQQSDGAWQTAGGVDFSGGFQIRVTAIDDQQLVDSIPAPPDLDPADPIAGDANFQ